MTTSNKKQYAANMLVREGKVFEQAKLDVKGLSIRKVSVNKTTREYFLDIINDQLLGNDDVTHGDILYAFYDYETRLKEGIMSFDLSFLTPAKYGVFDNYANPWMIQAVRGVFIWNMLNPDEPIQEYSKVKLLKKNITAPEQLLLLEDANMAAL